MQAPRPEAAALEAQFAYFVYRTLDCLPTLLTGSCHDLSVLDARSKWLARSLHLMLQHGDQLPEPEQVLPATEAIASLLFHACQCERASYPGHLRQAYEQAFVQGADLAALSPAQAALREAFDRALEACPPGEPAQGPRAAAADVQIRELAAALRDELREAS